MIWAPPLRRLVLLTHVVSSVGFLGAVAVFVVLAVAGISSPDPLKVRAAYLAGEMITWRLIVPLCFASLLTGLAVSLGTSWGLFRHYWVLIKLLITLFVTLVLMIHTRPVSEMAQLAAGMSPFTPDLLGAQIQLVVASGGGVLALLAAATLSIYKPRGLTRYGWRKQHEK
jgi:hypothetical protein